MYAALLLVALSFTPKETVLRDVVSVIEVNHMCEKNGSLVFDQIIFWRWVPSESAYRVAGWRILKSVREEAPKQVCREPDGWQPRPKWKGGHAAPLKRHDRGGWWISQWKDERDRVWREVAAPMYRETWTHYDPEVRDRQYIPSNQRMGLRQPKR